MSSAVLDRLKERRAELDAIPVSKDQWKNVTAWHSRTRPLVAAHFTENVSRLDQLVRVSWFRYPRVLNLGPASSSRQPVSAADLAEEKAEGDKQAVDAKTNLLAFLDALIELKELDVSASPTTPSDSPVVGRDVFVVHGHDEEMKQAVARTLSQLDLNPVILHEKPNTGRTIIEKFEHNADVGFAVVILSPDDMAYPAGAKPGTAAPRARQNVILELGYFAGKLGRKGVFALKRGEVEIPSDFSGVLYTTYDSGGSWRLELARELRAAGFDVDLNRLV